VGLTFSPAGTLSLLPLPVPPVIRMFFRFPMLQKKPGQVKAFLTATFNTVILFPSRLRIFSISSAIGVPSTHA